jgi:hypothetical protein
MAKKALIESNLFTHTEPTKPQPPAKEKRHNPVSVGLTNDELAQVDQAAAELGVKRHAILQHAIRQFLASWARGERPEMGSKAILKTK